MENGYQYLHLHLRNVKENIGNNFLIKNQKDLFLQDAKFGQYVRRQYNKSWSNIPEYARKRDKEFESMVKKVIEGGSYRGKGKDLAKITQAVQVGDLHGCASFIKGIREDGEKLKQAVSQLNDALDTLDKLDEKINENIFQLALLNPYIKDMLGLSIPDGIYKINNQENINPSIQTALNTARDKANAAIRYADGKTSDTDDPIETILSAIENIITSNRGFLYEVELLEGFLQAIQKGNNKIAVAYTGHLGKEKKDPNIKEDKQLANKLLEELHSAVSSIQTNNPKADLMCSIGENGAVSIFGISVKSISSSKQEAIAKGRGAKRYGIDLGSSYKTLKQILDKHGHKISQALGGLDPSWYGAQILTGWEGNHNSNSLIESGGGKYTASWNQVMNLCAMLCLSDALIGIGEQTMGDGIATYLVVNNQIYFMKDVLNKAALALERGENPGVYSIDSSLTRKWGQQIQHNAYVEYTKGSSIEQIMLQRSNSVWEEWNNAISQQIIKVSISLGALVHLAGGSELTSV